MRPPDKAGSAWSAWKRPADTTKGTELCSYIVHCPGVHPFWSWWFVGLVHLRAVEGLPPAHFDYPEAEYELNTIALDPQKCPPDVDAFRLPLMMPLDVHEQFHGVTDEQAVAMIERSVEMIVAGELAPDSDFRATWKRYVWGTIEHLTTGHPRGSA